MKQEIKELWVAALESDEFSQTIGALKDESGYCCLGVLCELHRRQHGSEWQDYGDSTRFYLGESGALPVEVYRWAGLISENPTVSNGEDRAALSEWNDSEGYNFKQIAKLIKDSTL